MNPEAVMMTVLREALSWRRPYGTRAEGRLVSYLARMVGQLRPDAESWVDTAGNLHVDTRPLRRNAVNQRTLFVAHVDTVHRSGGPNQFSDNKPMWEAAGGEPLGADDGAGVALMCGLIAGGIDAYFIFTRGEERGGHGAKHVVDFYPDMLREFDRAIAVDRKDVFSVITHQFAGRCCSTAFADALSDELNTLGMMMMPDDTGVYTDTAEFMEHIPECTNISAGYNREHTPQETLDTDYLKQLLAAMLQVKWENLPVERDPDDGDAEDDLKLMADMGGAPGWQAAYERWMKEDLMLQEAEALEGFDPITNVPDRRALTAEELIDMQNDPFAWSDDGRMVRYGSGRH